MAAEALADVLEQVLYAVVLDKYNLRWAFHQSYVSMLLCMRIDVSILPIADDSYSLLVDIRIVLAS